MDKINGTPFALKWSHKVRFIEQVKLTWNKVIFYYYFPFNDTTSLITFKIKKDIKVKEGLWRIWKQTKLSKTTVRELCYNTNTHKLPSLKLNLNQFSQCPFHKEISSLVVMMIIPNHNLKLLLIPRQSQNIDNNYRPGWPIQKLHVKYPMKPPMAASCPRTQKLKTRTLSWNPSSRYWLKL